MGKIFYRRNLPHYQPPHATFFITSRLDGSLPKEAIERLQQERDEAERYFSGAIDDKTRHDKFTEIRERYFSKFEELLDGASTGPHWLGDCTIAEIVKEAIHYRDGKDYDLHAYTIMPNHIHMVFHVERNDIPLYRIMQSLKRHTSRQANLILHRNGAFWQNESYDHIVRTGAELKRTIWYVLNNPVKANLVDFWEKWQGTYCKPGLL